MKKMSLQWRLTCIITLYIAVICGCVTMLVYKNGVYYMDSLQEAVDTRGDDQPDDAEEIYISIPEDKWDEFANDFSVQVYNNKADYRKNSLIISAVLALLGGVATYFISGHAPVSYTHLYVYKRQGMDSPQNGTIIIVPQFKDRTVKIIIADDESQGDMLIPILENVPEGEHYGYGRAATEIQEKTDIVYDEQQPLLALIYDNDEARTFDFSYIVNDQLDALEMDDYVYYFSFEFRTE